MTQQADEQREAAPANSLPDWSECALRVANSDFIAKRVAEGGYGAEGDSKLATELHRFIYEYDDADPYRSAWFMHRLELVLKEARALPPAAVQALHDAATSLETIASLAGRKTYGNPPIETYMDTFTDVRLYAVARAKVAREALAAANEGTHTATQGIYEPRLRSVLDVVQRYLPPGGIDAKTAMGEITALVDPWPGTVAGGKQGGDGVAPDRFAAAIPSETTTIHGMSGTSTPALSPREVELLREIRVNFNSIYLLNTDWRNEARNLLLRIEQSATGVALGAPLYECAECTQPDCNWRGECDGESCPTCGGHVVPVPAGVTRLDARTFEPHPPMDSEPTK